MVLILLKKKKDNVSEVGEEGEAFLLGPLAKGQSGLWVAFIVATLMLLSSSLAPAGSSVMSCVSCFFLSFGNSESAMIALLCLFGGVSIASWNALDVLTVELYPSDKR